MTSFKYLKKYIFFEVFKMLPILSVFKWLGLEAAGGAESVVVPKNRGRVQSGVCKRYKQSLQSLVFRVSVSQLAI